MTEDAQPEHYLKTELYELIRSDPKAFEFIESGSLDGIWYWNMEKPEDEWLSPRFKSFFGFEDHEMAHSTEWWMANIDPDDLKLAYENVGRHSEDPSYPYDQVLKYTHRDGTPRWVRCRGMAIRDEDGRPIRMLGAHNDVTAQKLAEERFRQLYERTPALVYACDDQGTIQFISDWLLQKFGFSRSALVGSNVFELIHPDDMAQATSPPVDDDGRVLEFPIRYRRHDGTYRECLVSANPETGPDGARLWLVALDDVTELRQAQRRLQELYEQTPALMHSLDERGRIEYVSDRWLETIGYLREEVVGRYSHEFLDEQSAHLARTEVLPRLLDSAGEGAAVGSAPAMHDVPYTFVCRDGSRRYMLMSAQAELDTSGRVRRIRKVLRDVTELRAAEELAERERAVRERVFETIPDAIVLADTERRIIDLNPAAESLFGYSTADVRGQQTAMLYQREEAYERTGETTFNPDAPNNRPSTRIAFQRRDGTSFWGDTHGGVIRQEDGTLVGFLGAIRDMTERQRERDALERSNRQLTDSLEALDQFAYIASHDLRTPLRGIRHLVRFLREDHPPEVLAPVEERLDQIDERAERMDEMLVALLRYVRSGGRDEQPEPIRLEAIAQRVEETQQLAHPDHRIVVTSSVRPDGREWLGSATSVEHVLANLIGNAVAHHDRAEVNIAVTAEVDDGMLHVRVVDDGPGIPARYHDRIFQIFQTLGSDKSQTSGMGLAIVRRLVSRAGGTIDIRSPVQEGRGTCFYFKMKLASRGNH